MRHNIIRYGINSRKIHHFLLIDGLDRASPTQTFYYLSNNLHKSMIFPSSPHTPTFYYP